MRKDLLTIALGLFLIAGRASADALAVPAPVDRANLPTKGTSMADVEKKFGEPSAKQPTVGGETAKHPPITRWDYSGFSVIFEKDKVVDAVVPGAPPQIYHQDQLKSTGSAPPNPAAATPTAPAEAPAPVTPVSMPAEAPAPAPEAQAAPAPEAPAAAAPTPAAEPAPATPAPAPAADPAPASPARVATPENPNPDQPKPK